MTAQQLKNSILQMAVQGKLVPQDPNDEPASILLERIKAEKQELIKAGKIKKDKKSSEIFRGTSRNIPYAYCEQIGKEFRDISDEIPFDIPESWEWCRWGELSQSIQYGYNAPAKQAGRIKMVRISDIQDNKVLWDGVPYCDIEESDINTYLLQVNDILFARTGGTVGKSYLVKAVPEEAIYAGYLIRTRYSNSLCPEYLKIFMESELYWTQLRNGTIATAQPNCNGKTLSNMILPVPPIEEQHRIVAKIEELLPYIEKYEQAETELTKLNETFPELLKKSILQEAVQGKLVPQDPNDEPASFLLEHIRTEKQALIKAGKIKKDKHESVIVTSDKIPYEILDGKERCIADEVPFDIPESWCWCRLKSIINAVSARRVHQSDWKNSGIPFYRAREIAKLAENGYIDNKLFISEELFAEYSQSGVPKSGDLMVTAVGTLGKTYIVKDTDRFYYKDASVICFENFGKICSKYLGYLMMSPYMETVIKDNSSGTTVGTITLVRANEYLIPLPPLTEQKRIVAKIEELMQYCDKL